MEKYKSFRLVNGEPTQVIVDNNGKIIDRNPNAETEMKEYDITDKLQINIG